MNPNAIRAAVRKAVPSKGRETRIGGGKSPRRTDEGNIRLNVQVGRMVTESMIEADFHQERFETDAEYVVEATPGAEVVSVEEV